MVEHEIVEGREGDRVNGETVGDRENGENRGGHRRDNG